MQEDTEVRESRKMFIMAHACTEHTRLVGTKMKKSPSQVMLGSFDYIQKVY